MKVIKRNGDAEDVSFDKVLKRLKVLSDNLNVDIYDIAQKVCARIYDGVKTSELDELAGHICSSMIVDHPDYGVLASRVIISNHHKNTSPSFSETVTALYNNKDGTLISEDIYNIIVKNKEKLNSYINYERDYGFDYFGFKTLEKSYLMKIDGVVVERPQHMFMRVALGIHGKDLKDALQTYDLMSTKYFVHATPTLFNAGTPRPQCSSCFLVAMKEDSIDGIFDTVKECALISKYAGGIGLHISNVRARNSRIRGTNGHSTGIGPMMKVFNNVARYVNQCFTPDTLVFSKNGAQRMDKIMPGDELVTIDGTYKKVNSVSIKEFDGNLLEISTKYAIQPIKVTKEHEMYVMRPNKKTPEFVAAGDLTTNDLVGYPIPTTVIDIEEDVDFCRFYGIMVRYGCMSNTQECRITLNTDTQEDDYKFVIKFLESCKMSYVEDCVDNSSTHTIKWIENQHVIPISYEDLYLNNTKRIHPRFINLPKEKSLALLKGLIDILKGLIDTSGSNLKELFFHTNSENVAMSVRYVLLRLGVLTSGYVKSDVGDSTYVLRIPKHEKIKDVASFTPYTKVGFFEHDGLLWSRITCIQDKYFKGSVYDFNMMDNHNYTVANFGLVHNSGRRNGSIAVYMEPWHADVETFLEMKRPQGSEEDRARDLFYALWVPDLFMERVKEDKMWSLMCPDMCPGLNDVYGEKFKELYEGYEAAGQYIKQVKAQDLWFKILELQIETGVPYILFKDACNIKSNQKNLGTIKSSNLCVAPDTMVLTSDGEFPISSLHNKTVNVWNGEEFSEVVVHKTGENQKLLHVEFDNGTTIRATPYHKFYIEDLNEPIECKDLKAGMQIASYRLPNDSSYRTVFVKSVCDNGDVEDTYCFTEPKENKGTFNGIVTGQCTEIVEYTDPNETSVCNLASICLQTFVETDENNKPSYNFEKLHEVVKVITKNLNKIIDINFYPVETGRRSNLRHRPIGIGVQGLADTFILMNMPFDSAEASKLNRLIFETIYHASLEQSMLIAKKRHEVITSATSPDEYDLHLNDYEKDLIKSKYPGAYSTFEGSPVSQGILQYDMWGVSPTEGRYDWDALKADIKKYGIRNSLLLAPMPTASTSQIMGSNEAIEPFTSNLYKRKTLAGEFILVNKYLMRDLNTLGLWNKDMKNKIIINDGSIQNIPDIPQNIKDLYKIVWEMKQKVLIDMAADRGAFICQSQSMNLFVEDATFQKLSSMHFYSWQKGLKTGIYYLRTRPRASAQKFTIDPSMLKLANLKGSNNTNTKDDESEQGCLNCSA